MLKTLENFFIGLLYFLIKRQWLKSFLTLISTSFLLILLYLSYINLFGWFRFSSAILYLFYNLSYYLILILGAAGAFLINTTRKIQTQVIKEVLRVN